MPRPRSRFCDAHGRVLPADRFDPFRLVVMGTTIAWKSSKIVTDALDGLDNMVRGHANWLAERRELAESVHDTIERLP